MNAQHNVFSYQTVHSFQYHSLWSESMSMCTSSVWIVEKEIQSLSCWIHVHVMVMCDQFHHALLCEGLPLCMDETWVNLELQDGIIIVTFIILTLCHMIYTPFPSLQIQSGWFCRQVVWTSRSLSTALCWLCCVIISSLQTWQEVMHLTAGSREGQQLWQRAVLPTVAGEPLPHI